MQKAESGWLVLKGFEADLAFLLGAGFADPDHAAADGIQFVIARDDLDQLSAFEPEAASEAEALGRTVHNEAGNPARLRAEIDDHAGSLSHGGTLGASGFMHGGGGHCFVLG
jgi:hypothetical protein